MISHVRVAAIVLLSTSWAAPARAAEELRHSVVIEQGRPLRVWLDVPVRVREVGQPVTGTLLDPIYVGATLAVPAGARVRGHIAAIAPVPKGVRIGALLNGNLTPPHAVAVEFDAIAAGGGDRAVNTDAVTGVPFVQESVAPPSDGLLAQARHDVSQKVQRTWANVAQPGRGRRVRSFLVGRLPVRRQYLPAGSVFTSCLLRSVAVETGEPLPAAPEAAQPAADSLLKARLLSSIDSKNAATGTQVSAVLTEPLLSAAGEVILPEGAQLTGHVTFSRAARAFRRNGQLRFVFDSLTVPSRAPQTLRGSLQAAELAADQRLRLDDEGGATVTNSRSRFVAPLVAGAIALAAVDKVEVSDEAFGATVTEANVAARGLRGVTSLGIVGTGLSIAFRPVAIATGAVGLGQALYVNLFAKGREVVFPVNTPIRVQVASGSERQP